jgi:hypothetical protein
MISSLSFSPLGARRLLALTGIGMILTGMIFGDIFAVFVLHQNAAKVGVGLTAASRMAVAGNAPATAAAFQQIGGFLENRGTKVDTHVHLIGFGYLALMLALLQPWVALPESKQRRLAWVFLGGGILLPVGVFLIHYVGLVYSPLKAIGWASIFADLGGLLVLAATIGFLAGLLAGLWKHFKSRPPVNDNLLNDQSSAGRLLLAGGLLLVIAGFAHGAWYAGVDLYRHEAAEIRILSAITSVAASGNEAGLAQPLNDYGRLQGEKAVNIAAHAHFIEFGILAMLAAFFQPLVGLSDIWKRRWAWTMLLGSALLPVCVLLELRFGLLAGGFADLGGLLVIAALLAVWIGILRSTGALDSEVREKSETERNAAPSSAREAFIHVSKQVLLFGGIALVVLGMCYGLWYAVFAEHQALDGIGSALTSSFSAAAQRNPALAGLGLQQYREAKYVYDRQVDVHGHWVGLGLLLIVTGIGAVRMNFAERPRLLLVITALAGSLIFPLGVLLQTWSHGPAPRAIAILGSALAIAGLTGMAAGFAVSPGDEN